MSENSQSMFDEQKAGWISEVGKGVREWLNGFDPSAPLVVVPVFNAYEDALECIQSLLKNTAQNIPILVIDDASTDPRIASDLPLLATEKRLIYLRKPFNSGFVDTVNLAFAWSAPRDVVVINSDVVVPPEWLERLRAAAYCMSIVATATPLTNSGTIVSVPYRNQPVESLVDGQTVEEVDARIREHSLRLYPGTPTAVGHCVYFRRSALDVVGYFDHAFAPGYGEEVDFSQRAVMAGFCHVVADDLFVYHKGSRSFSSRRQKLREAHEHLIRKRYPWYREWTTQAANETRDSLGVALGRAQCALTGYRIAIDITRIGLVGPVTGTQVYILESIHALARSPHRNAHISLILSDNVPQSALLGVENLVDEVLYLSGLKSSSLPSFHLVHRPFQVRTLDEMAFLRAIAERVVISQLDFLVFSNPFYATSPQEWREYRAVTQLAFNVADGIIFSTQEVAKEAPHWGLWLDSERVCVIPPGVNHQLTLPLTTPSPNLSRLPSPPFILMLGTSFLHKNRLYALQVLKRLVSKYGWDGKLVFAGPTPSVGGSEEAEISFLQDHPEVRPYVCYLGPVTPEEKTWLLQNASLLLYPSTREGFGLVPFEAAAVGTPALTARMSALTEVLGDEVIYLEDFDPEKGAATVWSFLSDPEVRTRQVQAIRKQMNVFTWEKAATRAWEFYNHILNMPPRFSDPLPFATPFVPRSIIVSPPQTPLYKRAIWRVAQTIRICADEWRQLFGEALQYLRFLWAQRLTK